MSNSNLEEILASLEAELAQVNSVQALEQLRIKYLGRKGILAELTATIPSLPAQERPAFGQMINSAKERMSVLFAEKQKSLGTSAGRAASDWGADISMPGICQELGTLHPITQV